MTTLKNTNDQHYADHMEASKNAAFEVAVLRVQSRLARDARMVW